MIKNETLIGLYGAEDLEKQKARYDNAEKSFREFFGDKTPQVFSAPGRTELGGNHTDHNGGMVLAAAVGLDVIAFAAPTEDNTITVKSEGFSQVAIDLSELGVNEGEKNTSAALIRGIAAGFKRGGYQLGGFSAYITSNVLKGSGLSSSAAFEIVVGTILSHLYNGGRVSPVALAKIGQFAENVYFGKPCGLMDQFASALGGVVMLDFKDSQDPATERIDYDFSKSGHTLYVINTGGDHADLTAEYAAVPEEMKAVAEVLGGRVLRDVTAEQLWRNLAEVREKCGDRAVLRALHFFDENRRVNKMTDCLKKGDVNGFLNEVNKSGNSSFKYLQNAFNPSDTRRQGLVAGLYFAERILGGEGAHRVHGGGFAGTIQAFVPDMLTDEFISETEAVFGAGSCVKLRIRPFGGVKL